MKLPKNRVRMTATERLRRRTERNDALVAQCALWFFIVAVCLLVAAIAVIGEMLAGASA